MAETKPISINNIYKDYIWNNTISSNKYQPMYTLVDDPWTTPAPIVKENTISVEDVNKVEEIIEKLKELGAFLHGSRDKLKNNKYADFDTDWDFAVSVDDFSGYFYNINKDGKPLTELGNYILNNFYHDFHGYEEGVVDLQAIFKHNNYPHITIQVLVDLPKYKKVWRKIPKDYWHNYLWKSNPSIAFDMKNSEFERRWKNRKQATFKMLYQFMEPTLLEEFI